MELPTEKLPAPMELPTEKLPAPVAIVCRGCRWAIWQKVLKEDIRDLIQEQVFCLILKGWVWDGNPDEGYPVECSGRSESEEGK